MPPAFVLSQDQTLRFALGQPTLPRRPAKAQGTHLNATWLPRYAAASAHLAPPPAHPFSPLTMSKNKPNLPAGARLIGFRLRARQPGFLPGPAHRFQPSRDTKPRPPLRGVPTGSVVDEGRRGGREAIYSPAPWNCPAESRRKMRHCGKGCAGRGIPPFFQPKSLPAALPAPCL
jgi:hypothetical protein